jgi:hypothetical protein
MKKEYWIPIWGYFKLTQDDFFLNERNRKGLFLIWRFYQELTIIASVISIIYLITTNI